MKNSQQICEIDNGNICSPIGFKSSGISAGLKQNGGLDIALILSDLPAVTAGVFTTNKVTAAPVQFCKESLQNNINSRAMIINSGNANACTGKKGYDDTVSMVNFTAEQLNLKSNEVLVASTGRIGVCLPMVKISNGISRAVDNLSYNCGHDSAKAIMTTDTRPKEVAVKFMIDNRAVTVAGMAKGAGMIDPNLKGLHATMLAFITTDANVSHEYLNSTLIEATDKSFNRITVDGDMSTNDSLFIMANGAAENSLLDFNTAYSNIFSQAVGYVTEYLAKEIVRDGEGMTKLVTVLVENATSQADAKLCAESIANSLLCKTAWFGCDPNWGRILAAAGYSGAEFDQNKINIYYDNIPVVLDGIDSGVNEKDVVEVLNNNVFTVKIDLCNGNSSYYIWTNDISYEYVKINADYHT